jgi:hypothetical protein
MKERPILMTPANAQKCHEGTKTQTRRIVKVPDWATDDGMLKLASQRPATGIAYYVDGVPVKRLTCPYGQVGDRLWVRESWAIGKGLVGEPDFIYKGNVVHGHDSHKWRPSLHMPLLACRTVLEITALRVERLQEITEEDVIAEGVNRIAHGRNGDYYSAFRDDPHHDNWIDPVGAYKELWESINGKGSWKRNDWVWVVSFRNVQVVE